jgi:RIO-like serine/threonine protein kinase
MNGHIVYSTKFSTDIDKFQVVAENQNLSKKELRVFMSLCCRMSSRFYIKVDKNQLAQTLCIPKKDVEKALDNLENEGIIIKGSDEHVKSGYKMSYTGYNKD